MFDPEVLQILGLNLMAGRSPNFAENLGNAGLATMQYRRQQEEDKQRKEERDFLKQQREMQMAQMKRQQQFQDALSQGFRPGVAADPLTPMDDEGNPMPSSRPTMDFSRAMQIDPFAAMQAQAQFQNFNKPQTTKLGKGEAVFGADGRKLFDNPEPQKPEKPKYVKGDMQTYSSSGITYTREFDGENWRTIAKTPQFKPDAPEKPPAAPSGYRYKSDGTLEKIPGGPAEERGKPSEAELKAAGYAMRMQQADSLLTNLGPAALPGVAQTIANNRAPTLAPYLSSPQQQKYRQAQEDWVRAKLRQESGAVIADEEMAREIRVYFPQPGDSPQVIQQKAEARQLANNAMMVASGKARQEAVSRAPNIDDLVRQYAGGR